MATKIAAASTELKWMLAILWFIQAVNYTTYIWILTIEAGAGTTAAGEENALILAIFYFLPCLLAVVAFLIRPAVARSLHIIVGSLFALIKIGGTVGGATGMIGGTEDGISIAVVFNEFWGIFAAAWIVQLAWKWEMPQIATARS